MKKILLLSSIAAIVACSSPSTQTTSSSNDSTNQATAENTVSAQTFGAAITEDSAIAITELGALMKDKNEIAIKLSGEVEAVCQKKGCWMDLKNPGDSSLHVTFLDYGFFVPKDAAGKTAIIDGVAKWEETSVADLQEIAKDAGKSKAEIAAINKPEKQLVFEAKGVILK